MYTECDASGGGLSAGGASGSAAPQPMEEAESSDGAAIAARDVAVHQSTEGKHQTMELHSRHSAHQDRKGECLETDIHERLRKLNSGDSCNFHSWNALIVEVESTCPDSIDTISLAYDSFLSKFPLCHWYWRKYAYHIVRLSEAHKAVTIFDRALDSSPYSLGLWIDYCFFAMSFYEDQCAVRRLFKMGILFAGKDYFSHALWDLYIKFEFSQQNWSSLANIYLQVLRFPTGKLHRYYDNFEKFVSGMEEEMRQQKNYMLELEEGVPPNAATLLSENEISRLIEDLQNPSDEALTCKALHKYKFIGEQLYQKACDLDDKIKGFETNIKRQYFDVTPLDDEQLKNWHQYLDFSEKQGDFLWALHLYERCLIACANYPEFWMRYVEFVESKGGRELANVALKRATEIFLKDVPEIHLFNARFKERIGDASAARAAFGQRDMGFDSYLTEHVIELANMERRLGNLEAAYDIYEKAINVAEDKKHWHSLSSLYIHLSRLKYMITRSADAAREVMIDGIRRIPHSRVLLEELIRFAMMHDGATQVNLLDSIIAPAISLSSDGSQGLDPKDQEDLSSLFLEFVDLCGTVDDVRKARNRHIRLFPHLVRNNNVHKHPNLGDYSSNEISEQRRGSSCGLPHLLFETQKSKINHNMQEPVDLLSVNQDCKPDLVPNDQSLQECDENEEQERRESLSTKVVKHSTEAASKVNELDQDLGDQLVDDTPGLLEATHNLAEHPREDEPEPMDVTPALVHSSCEDTSAPDGFNTNLDNQSRLVACFGASSEHFSPTNFQKQELEHLNPDSVENPSLNSQELIPMASDEHDATLEIPKSNRNVSQDCLNSKSIPPISSPYSTPTPDSAQVLEQSNRIKSGSLPSQASHEKHTPKKNSVVTPVSSGECKETKHTTVPEGGSSEIPSCSVDQLHQNQQTSPEPHSATVAFRSQMLMNQGRPLHSLVSEKGGEAEVHHDVGAVQENVLNDHVWHVNYAPDHISFPTNQPGVSSPLVSSQKNLSPNILQYSQHSLSTNQSQTLSQIWQYYYQQQHLLQQQYQQQVLQMMQLQQQHQQSYQQQQQLQPQHTQLQSSSLQQQPQPPSISYQSHQLQQQQAPYFLPMQQYHHVLMQQGQEQQVQQQQLLSEHEQQFQLHYQHGCEQHAAQAYQTHLQQYQLNLPGYGQMIQQEEQRQQQQYGYSHMMQHQSLFPWQKQQKDEQKQQYQQRASEQEVQEDSGQLLEENAPEGSDSQPQH